MLQVLGKRVEAELFGNAVVSPWLCRLLEAAQQQLARIFLVVGLLVGHEQHRQVARQFRQRFGDDVEMLSCMKRQGNSARGGEFARPHAPAYHHFLRPNFALGRDGSAGSPCSTRMRSTRMFSRIVTPAFLRTLCHRAS